MYEYLDRRYALAYYKVAEEKCKIDQYINEFREMVKLLNENRDLIQVINDPKISTSRKKEIVKEIFQDKVNYDLISFINVLISKKRIHTINGILVELEKIDLDNKGTIKAMVKSVIPLNVAEKEELIKKLKNKYNKNILLEEEIDITLIGGILIKVDDDIIDGTIKNKLSEIQKAMLKNEQDL